MAGLAAAYDAYRLSLGRQPAPVVGGLTGDQQFFLSFAQSWRDKTREPALRQQIIQDGHAPGRVPRRHRAQPRRLVRRRSTSSRARRSTWRRPTASASGRTLAVPARASGHACRDLAPPLVFEAWTPPLRVLVVGCGNMGASHARAYHRMPEFEIVGLVSRGAGLAPRARRGARRPAAVRRLRRGPPDDAARRGQHQHVPRDPRGPTRAPPSRRAATSSARSRSPTTVEEAQAIVDAARARAASW